MGFGLLQVMFSEKLENYLLLVSIEDAMKPFSGVLEHFFWFSSTVT